MSKITHSSVTVAGLVFAAVGLTAAVATRASAQVSCNTFLQIAIGPAGPVSVGGTKTIDLTLGADGIQGGTEVTITNVRYELDCNNNFPLGVPCTDQGDIFKYQGDGTISTTCGVCAGGNLNAGSTCAPTGPGSGCDAAGGGDNLGTCVPVTWTSNVPAGGSATNEIVFTASPAVAIPIDNFSYCDLTFDVKLDNLEATSGPSSDNTHTDVEIVAGFSGSDAVCDNTLPSEGSQSASIPTAAGAPVCGNGAVESGETCDDGTANGDCSMGAFCQTDCTRCLREDPALIKFRQPAKPTDRIFVHARFEDDHAIDIPNVPAGIRLSDGGGTFFSADIPAGSLAVKKSDASKTIYEYRNPAAKTSPGGGIARFWLDHDKCWYRMKVEAYGDLSMATAPQMTVTLVLDQEEYTSAGTWSTTAKGRKLKMPGPKPTCH